MAKQRALLTDTEREILSGEREVKDNYRYSVESRVRTRLREQLPVDVELLSEHRAEMFDEMQSAVCDDAEGVESPSADASVAEAPTADASEPQMPEPRTSTEPSPQARIPDPAVTELDVDGRLLYRLEQRKENDLEAIDTAAIVASMRTIADRLEAAHLDRSADEILEAIDHGFSVHDDDPGNVGE